MLKKLFDQKGITLLELVLVLSIMTLAFSGIFNFYLLAGKTWQKTSEDASYTDEIRSLLLVLGDEIREAAFIEATSNQLELKRSEKGLEYTIKYRVRDNKLEKSRVKKGNPDNFKPLLEAVYPLRDNNNQPLPFFQRQGKKVVIRFKIEKSQAQAKPLYVEEVFAVRNKGV
ncbi:hypothetical protein SAMN02745221_00714 [Thermosyntropha lipolytica DSM 11003]|uniref:Prepilin-type N-terminal cleavage/methylation domain-containing protein n=1 Tax=Thermosyntropha lipolytica DSM 11003 TaxID=1123382 RepID=A0A1M5LN04_9FIRM|nr:type II secretion system protein [Thermosyntropha lipolytica]SHG66474.1 hypothetical protein SAMN02745221_00714 [Thermosyntropha lipolytica DSM 11003]